MSHTEAISTKKPPALINTEGFIRLLGGHYASSAGNVKSTLAVA